MKPIEIIEAFDSLQDKAIIYLAGFGDLGTVNTLPYVIDLDIVRVRRHHRDNLPMVYHVKCRFTESDSIELTIDLEGNIIKNSFFSVKNERFSFDRAPIVVLVKNEIQKYQDRIH